MISERAIRNVQRRIYSFNFCGGTFISFDKKSGKVVPANTYISYNGINDALGGLFFVFVHIMQVYLKNNPNDIPEEEGGPQDPALEKHKMFAFATNVIAWGEILVIISISGVSWIAFTKRDLIMELFNEIFAYNKTIAEFLKSRNIELDRQHRKAHKKLEGIVFACNVGSVTIGLLVLITCLHPLEPTHVIIKEWFEIEWEWRPKLIPWILLFTVAIQYTVNTVMIFALMIALDSFMVTGVLSDLTVERLQSKQGARCTLETRYYGVLEDQEICVLYRIQRYLNERINEVMASIFISLHQVGMLSCLAIMLFFFVKYQNVIWEVGPIAAAVVVGSMCAPLAISWFQSQFFGVLVDTSDEFRENAMRIVPRKTMFRRFAYTCQTYYIEEAYPFFHFHKNTFLEFCAAGLDHAINLMFW